MRFPSPPKLSTPQVSRPMISHGDVESAREKQRALQQRRAGYASTIATRGGQGILNVRKAEVLGKTQS